MKKNWIILGVVAIGGYIIWKKMKANNNTNNDGNVVVDVPVNSEKPLVSKSLKMNNCPTKEQLASRRYTQAQMNELKAMGCL
jgi:hypothetical protein